MEYTTKLESSRKLNTKGCCFLCLKNVKNHHEGNEVHQDFIGGLEFISIRQLLRHLQIPAGQSLNQKSLFGQDLKNEDIQVEFCENCGEMISRYSILFQKLVKIQLEMDYFLERIHTCISQFSKSPDLVHNYSKRMTSDLEALSQLAFVDNLRKQIAEQSLKKLNVPRPQLILTRANIIQIKTESKKKTCKSNAMEFSGDCFNDETLPPPSPNSSPNNEEDLKINFSASSFTESETRSPSLRSPVKQIIRRGEYYTKHTSSGMYECTRCEKKSKYPHTIIMHYQNVHLKLSHKCDICNASVFTYLHHLIIHKKTCREKLEKKSAKEKDPKFKFICKICGKRFETRKKLSDHTRFVHKYANRYQCDLCDKKYTTMYSLKNHQAAIHQSRKLRCKECNEIYKDLGSYRKHERKCVTVIKVKLENVECE